jgi:hypothetical protein
MGGRCCAKEREQRGSDEGRTGHADILQGLSKSPVLSRVRPSLLW